VQGVGYSEFEVETNTTALKLEMGVTIVELEMDTSALELETKTDVSQEISKQEQYLAD
jgi:hypothetical protein